MFIAFCSLAGLVALSGLVIMFVPAVADIAQTVVTDSLLTKSNSDSAIERGMMNTQAWQVFKDTSGVGAGIGSTRASNYALVLLSNLGLPGFCLFVAMLLALVFGRLDNGLQREARAIVWAARVGIVTIVLLARALGFGRNPALDDATARSVAEAALPGFVAVAATVDPHARTGTVTGRDGRTATVRPHGDRWVVRT